MLCLSLEIFPGACVPCRQTVCSAQPSLKSIGHRLMHCIWLVAPSCVCLHTIRSSCMVTSGLSCQSCHSGLTPRMLNTSLNFDIQPWDARHKSRSPASRRLTHNLQRTAYYKAPLQTQQLTLRELCCVDVESHQIRQMCPGCEISQGSVADSGQLTLGEHTV